MEHVAVGTDHDLDCIYEAVEGFSYLTTICRAPTCTHVVQVIEEGLGPDQQPPSHVKTLLRNLLSAIHLNKTEV